MDVCPYEDLVVLDSPDEEAFELGVVEVVAAFEGLESFELLVLAESLDEVEDELVLSDFSLVESVALAEEDWSLATSVPFPEGVLLGSFILSE